MPQPEPVALSVAEDGSVALPSGLVVRLHETLFEPLGVPAASAKTVRLRYVSPQLEADAFGFEAIEGDFSHLCATFGLRETERSAQSAEQIIISIASAPSDFGETAPSVVQYFDAFRVDAGSCIWEGL